MEARVESVDLFGFNWVMNLRRRKGNAKKRKNIKMCQLSTMCLAEGCACVYVCACMRINTVS